MAIFCGGRERVNLFSPRDKEERGRVGRRARRKKRSEEAGVREDLPRRKESPGTLYRHYPSCS